MPRIPGVPTEECLAGLARENAEVEAERAVAAHAAEFVLARLGPFDAAGSGVRHVVARAGDREPAVGVDLLLGQVLLVIRAAVRARVHLVARVAADNYGEAARGTCVRGCVGPVRALRRGREAVPVRVGVLC